MEGARNKRVGGKSGKQKEEKGRKNVGGTTRRERDERTKDLQCVYMCERERVRE